MYRYDATTATLAIGAPTAARGTAPAIDHGTSGASTTAVFSQIDCKSFIIWISFLCGADGSA